MPNSAFGDTLAMVLVFVGGVLTGVLIWLLMRKYNRDHPKDGNSPRVATPTMSHDSTAPIVGPFRKEGVDHRTTVPATVPLADKTAQPKVPAAPPQPASEPPPVRQNVVAEEKKETAPLEKQPSSRKNETDFKVCSPGKTKKPSPTTALSTEDTKELSKSGHRRRKAKKFDQKSPSPVDSGLSKRKSKRKQPKPTDSQVVKESPAESPSKVTASAPTTQEPLSPKQQMLPSEQQVSPPERQMSPSSDIEAEIHESVDPDLVKELREIVIKRRASHVSMHSTRQQRNVPTAPKVPAELDIFSDEHTSERLTDVTTPPHKRSSKHKHKAGKTVVLDASPQETAAGSPGAMDSSESATATAAGTPTTEAPGRPPTTKNVDEPTLKELREMVIKRRASCMSVHSAKSGRHAPKEETSRRKSVSKPPANLDIFSEQHSSIMSEDEPPLRPKKGVPKVKLFSEQPSPE